MNKRTFPFLSALAGVLATGAFGSSLLAPPAFSQDNMPGALQFPVDCQLGDTCYLQNLVDLDRGPGIVDTLCSADTYDNHKGIDIRVPSVAEMAAGVDVLAAADGVVAGVRDEMADQLIDARNPPAGIKGRECGNGVVINHADGLTTQYCHLQRGSVRVSRGELIKAGDVLGRIGASGFTEFPHLHLSVRKGGTEIDPLSGGSFSADQCDAAFDDRRLAGPFGKTLTDQLLFSREAIIGVGLSGKLLKLDDLVYARTGDIPTGQSDLAIGWGWAINLKERDQLRVVVSREGNVFSDSTSKPLEKRKATFFFFSGRKRSPVPGDYTVTVSVLRNGAEALTRSERFTVSN